MKNAVLQLTTNHRAVRCGRLQTMLYLEAGQRIIIVAGMPLGTPGATNMVRIAFVGGNSAGEVFTARRGQQARAGNLRSATLPLVQALAPPGLRRLCRLGRPRRLGRACRPRRLGRACRPRRACRPG